jgi:glutathione peroxidase
MRKSGLAGAFSFVTMLLSPTVVTAAATQSGSAYDHSFVAIEGYALPLATFKGKVMLVVNTASFCGYTPQYQGLQKLWDSYEAQGLVVIGVPSNDFAQEPKAEDEIKTFCQGMFGITFPLTAKEEITGAAAHPFYRWAAAQLGGASAPRWNFHKYLVGRDGQLIASYGPNVTPDSAELVGAITSALARQ